MAIRMEKVVMVERAIKHLRLFNAVLSINSTVFICHHFCCVWIKMAFWLTCRWLLARVCHRLFTTFPANLLRSFPHPHLKGLKPTFVSWWQWQFLQYPAEMPVNCFRGRDDTAALEKPKQLLQEAVILPAIRPDVFRGIRRPWKVRLLLGHTAADQLQYTVVVRHTA